MKFPNVQWNDFLAHQADTRKSENELAKALALMISQNYPDVEETDFIVIDIEATHEKTCEGEFMCCGVYQSLGPDHGEPPTVWLTDNVTVDKDTLIILAGKNP